MGAIEFPRPDLTDFFLDGEPPTPEQKVFHLRRLATELVERLKLEPLDNRWGALLMGTFLNLSKYLTHLNELEKK